MKEYFFSKNTASKIFWVWIFIQSILWIISIYDGSALKDMLQSVDYAEKSDASGLGRNEGAWWFVLISLIFFIVCTIFAAFLIHFTEKRRRWAFWLLVPYSIWSFYYSVSYPFKISEMYSKEIDFWGIFNGLLGGLVWVVVLYFAYSQYQIQNIAK